ncbi:MAG: YfiR family protein [Thermodesulfobacteriota bacterium]
MEIPLDISRKGINIERSHFYRCLCSALLIGLFLFPGTAPAKSMEEHQVKAAFIYKLILFTQWPEQDNDSLQPDFIIGILGPTQFNKAFQPVIGKDIFGKRLTVNYLAADASRKQIEACRILYISKELQPQLAQLLEQQRDKPILTISDMEGFTKQGGMVTLFEQEGRLRFSVNLKSARQAGIQFRAQLLRLASGIESL